MSLGCLTGVPIAGQILDRASGSYDGLIILVGLCYSGGLCFFLIARFMETGWRLNAKY